MEKKVTPRIHENALARARRRGTSYEYELTKILKGYDPLRKPNKNAKINKMTATERSAENRRLNNIVETAVGKATLKERECASKRACRHNTSYLYELDRILTGAEPIRNSIGRPSKASIEEPKQVAQAMQPTQPIQEEQFEQAIEEVETVHEFDYLGTLELAIEIVRGVKDEEDVKLAVDKVFETLKYRLTK